MHSIQEKVNVYDVKVTTYAGDEYTLEMEAALSAKDIESEDCRAMLAKNLSCKVSDINEVVVTLSVHSSQELATMDMEHQREIGTLVLH